MTHIEKLIVETWRIHNRSCLFLIKNLPQEELSRQYCERLVYAAFRNVRMPDNPFASLNAAPPD